MAFVSITRNRSDWTPRILAQGLDRAGGGETPGVLWIGDGTGQLTSTIRSCAGLILVGAQTPGDGGRQRVRLLLEADARFVPEAVLLSREGLPTVRRHLETAPWSTLHVVLETQPADALSTRSEALIAVARAAGRLAAGGRYLITGVDVRVGAEYGSCEADPAHKEFLCKLFAALLRPPAR